MFTENLIDFSIAVLNGTETAEEALEAMETAGVQELPVVQGQFLAGILSKEDIEVNYSPDEPLSLRLSELLKTPAFIAPGQHVFEAMRRMRAEELSILPVIAENGHFQGVISLESALESLCEIAILKEPGGILILEVERRSYSVVEIGRICESNDVKIIGLNLLPSPSAQHIYVILKLNVSELSRVVMTFERFHYTILAVCADVVQLNDTKERWEALIRYLNV